jgi:hypothetical protein
MTYTPVRCTLSARSPPRGLASAADCRLVPTKRSLLETTATAISSGPATGDENHLVRSQQRHRPAMGRSRTRSFINPRRCYRLSTSWQRGSGWASVSLTDRYRALSKFGTLGPATMARGFALGLHLSPGTDWEGTSRTRGWNRYLRRPAKGERYPDGCDPPFFSA